jgi:hypothetical protein
MKPLALQGRWVKPPVIAEAWPSSAHWVPTPSFYSVTWRNVAGEKPAPFLRHKT